MISGRPFVILRQRLQKQIWGWVFEWLRRPDDGWWIGVCASECGEMQAIGGADPYDLC